ncbi:glyoxylate/hydroxypyruvate reductase A [Loktanella atrilutea]|uniref:Glyoxylate/hydroxypyruvate reductase A n=1 Tax=Loktanella atrilutea TaxID=366533 RepID=A0A1M5CUN1_LOKAT|nr:glyoxylate/hydroxypyruvate reductase A [Loktanella atrilutea]SHF58470.1 glyoxylate/hydroxypyruvate reductase A [Loktanella atrilutea]
MKILFSAKPDVWDDYEAPLRRALDAAGLRYDLSRDHAPGDVDYIVFAPNGPVKDFTPYVNTRLVMGLWAGVETVVGNETLTQPLARMVDDGLTRGMVEWVVGHVMRHHLGLDAHIHGQDGEWRNDVYPPLAQDRPVTVLGLGELGSACGQALAGLGFPVTGWSRSPKRIDGLTCLSGADGLRDALTDAQIVVLLLPQTPATEDILNADTLALLAPGAVIVNPGRGPLIDDDALLAALDSGAVGAATLDVFRTEPLPRDHPYWAHPRVTVTPHIASTTRPETAAQVIAANIARGERGEPFLHLVDRTAGY